MKKSLIILAVIGILGYGSFHFWKKWEGDKKSTSSSRRATSATVEARNIRFAINTAGDIGPADQVSVRPEVNGKIALLPVDIGDTVKKGDILFTLDDADLQIELAARRTEIAGAKLQLEKAKRNFNRIQKLFADNLISQEVFDDSRTELALAENSVDRTDQALRLVEDRLSKTKIVAPFDCTVLTRPVSVGQAVSGSAGFNSGTEVMTIANLKDMIILAHINQADVTRVMPGQVVDIVVESVPGLKMQGEVERIAPQATIKNNLKGFSARIVLKEIDPRIRPGMTANVAIPVVTADNVLSIPLAAVFTESGERVAYVKTSTVTERRPIQIGVTDYRFAEVTAGLSAGEIVSLVPPEESVEAQPGSDRGARPGGRPGGTNRPAGGSTTRRTAS